MIYQEETGESEITELMTSFDEHVYSAKDILTSKRIIIRPLNLLYPIECSNGNHDVTSEKTHQFKHWKMTKRQLDRYQYRRAA